LPAEGWTKVNHPHPDFLLAARTAYFFLSNTCSSERIEKFISHQKSQLQKSWGSDFSFHILLNSNMKWYLRKPTWKKIHIYQK
jgi:hypothetical protein